MHNWLFKLLNNGKKDRLDDGTKTLIVVLFYVIVSIVLLMVYLLYFDYTGHQGAAKAYLGTFGDFFGGVLNPILTFGTLIGLSATIVLQRIALRASRLQAFETTLFNMLALHNNIVQQLRFNNSMLGKKGRSSERGQASMSVGVATYTTPPDPEGRSVFKAILSRLSKLAESENKNIVEIYKEDLQESHNYVLGHYFRNLYQILRLIRRNEGEALSSDEAQEYTAIIRSQLSAHELALLFLNCQQGVVDGGKFRNLVIRYELFEHLPLSFASIPGKISLVDFSVDEKYLNYYLMETFKRDSSRSRGYTEYRAGAYGTNGAVQKYLPVLNEKAAKSTNEQVVSPKSLGPNASR